MSPEARTGVDGDRDYPVSVPPGGFLRYHCTPLRPRPVNPALAPYYEWLRTYLLCA